MGESDDISLWGLPKIKIEGEKDEYATFCRDMMMEEGSDEDEDEIESCGIFLDKEERDMVREWLDAFVTDAEVHYTNLMWSVRSCDEEAVRLLIRIGVDVNTENKCGQTALSVARDNQRGKHISDDEREAIDEIVKILIQYGATE